MTDTIGSLAEKIKILKSTRDILTEEYNQTEYHKKKEENPDISLPTSPNDEQIYKLLTAIQQIDHYIKKYQDEQFLLIKEQDQ